MSKAENPREGSGRETTPKRFAETTPPNLSSGEQGFPLLAFMELQRAVGSLTEAVKSLQLQSDKHDIKLGEIGKDVHTVKVTARVIGVVLAGAIAFAGWSLGKAVDVFVKLYQPYTVQRQAPPPQNPESSK